MKMSQILLAFVVLSFGCGGDNKDAPTTTTAMKKSDKGESCTKTDDCTHDLRCVGNVCVEAAEVVKPAKNEFVKMVVEEEELAEDDESEKLDRGEGKFGDKIDPRKVGVLELLRHKGSIEGVMGKASDDGAPENKLALAMPEAGDEPVGGNDTGDAGEGTGGGGTGFGRIHGLGRIDTSGGRSPKRKMGQVKMGGGAATGFCKKSDIARFIKRAQPSIRACYEIRLKFKPELAGKLTVRWTIGTDGAVKAVTTSGSLSDSSVKNCVMRRFRRMRFPKPEGGICVVKWPFVFSPG